LKRRVSRLFGLVAAATAIGLAFGGCAPGKTQPTDRVIYITLTPSPGPTETPTPVPTVSPTPTDTPTPVPTESPTPEASATASATTSATAAGPTDPPPARAVPASTCTLRGAANQTFWATVSQKMSWDVYCPVLPAGWQVSAKLGYKYDLSVGPSGVLSMAYTGPNGETLRIDEGSFCTGQAAACSPGAVIETIVFGDLLGSLDSLPGGDQAVYVKPGAAKSYKLTGSGISQAALVQIARDVAKVARP
jgi:hypothetical protein